MKSLANAKVNIGLNIIFRRPDGYHNIESLFVPINLSDEIEIEILPRGCNSHELVLQGLEIEGDINENLVMKALRLVDIPFVRVTLNKRIPTGAGLGGGSSDAATVLKMVNEMFSLSIPNEKMCTMLSTIGADCAFFVNNTCQFAEGIGDVLTTIDFPAELKGHKLLIVKPNITVSTKTAYSGITPRPSDYPILFAVQSPLIKWKEILRNDFEETVFRAYPQLASIKQNLYNSGALYVQMSGSGAAIFGIFKNDSQLPVFKDCFTWIQTL